MLEKNIVKTHISMNIHFYIFLSVRGWGNAFFNFFLFKNNVIIILLSFSWRNIILPGSHFLVFYTSTMHLKWQKSWRNNIILNFSFKNLMFTYQYIFIAKIGQVFERYISHWYTVQNICTDNTIYEFCLFCILSIVLIHVKC